MVAQHESAVDGSPSPSASNTHPAGEEGGGLVAELPPPRCRMSAGWRDDHRLTPVEVAGRLSDDSGAGHFDTFSPICVGHGLNRAVEEDRADRGIQAGKGALSLSKRVSLEN